MPMTDRQYCATIAKLGLSQLEAGRVLGVAPRTAQRYASGETAVPEPVAKLLRLMLARGIAPDELD